MSDAPEESIPHQLSQSLKYTFSADVGDLRSGEKPEEEGEESEDEGLERAASTEVGVNSGELCSSARHPTLKSPRPMRTRPGR